ncbi:TPA: antirestriction protein ArdR [Klebsiella pneumoniae]|nr:antirestriction protein ArdR [Klebsiella pneumoniae]
MLSLHDADKEKFGERVYHHFRKQGNFRWDTAVFKKDDGRYSVVFRYSFSKKNAEGIKKTYVRNEKVIFAENEGALKKSVLPEYPDSEILKHSDFFKSLRG